MLEHHNHQVQSVRKYPSQVYLEREEEKPIRHGEIFQVEIEFINIDIE